MGNKPLCNIIIYEKRFRLLPEAFFIIIEMSENTQFFSDKLKFVYLYKKSNISCDFLIIISELYIFTLGTSILSELFFSQGFPHQNYIKNINYIIFTQISGFPVN